MKTYLVYFKDVTDPVPIHCGMFTLKHEIRKQTGQRYYWEVND